MTVGSKTEDRRRIIDSNYPAGSYAQRTWSGGDWPPLDIKVRDIALPDIEVYRYVWNPVLRKKEKILWTKSTNNHKLVYDKPVRRATIEHHAYDVSGFSASALTGVRWRQTNIGQPWSWWSVFLNGQIAVGSSDPWSSNDDIALVNKLRDKVAGSSFNALVTLGESGESLAMITNSATRIYKSMKLLRKGNVVKAAHELVAGRPDYRTVRRQMLQPHLRRTPAQRAAMDTSSVWLELQYGWIPLVQDAKAGAEFLAHAYSAPLLHKVSVTHNAGGGRRKANFALDAQWYPTQNSHFRVKGLPMVSSKKLTAYIRETNVPALAGLQNPEAAFWELTPFSFVADWFIPIGDYLEARALLQSLSATYVVNKRTVVELRGPVYGTASEEIDPLHCEYEGRYYAYTFSRSAELSDLPLPTPRLKGFGQAASWKHCVNAVALLIQNFGTK